MSLLVRITGIAGLQSYSCGASSINFTGGGVNVNGSPATYSVIGDFIVISSPVIAGGDEIDVNGTATSGEDVTVTNFPSTQPVSFPSAQHVIIDSMPGGGSSADVTDRSARLLGHVNVDNWPATQPVSIASAVPVTGTFWQATQPVSIAASLAVTGTFWQATQPVSGTFWQATQPVSIASMPSTPVTGTFWQATQPVSIAAAVAVTQSGAWSVSVSNFPATQAVSAASLPLPTGAATSAKQPALGTAGAASADVLSVQGVASMTALKVDGSAVTQPVSGTVTANAGTNLNTSALALDATLTGGTARAKITDGTNNAAVKAASTAPVATDPAIVVVQSPNGYATSVSRVASAAASINATVVKASAGRVFKIKGYNAAAAVRYIKLFNKASAVPAPASDAALIIMSIALKASDQFDIDFAPQGIAFSTGIGFTMSTGSADTDATALTAADIVGLNIFYA